MSADRQPLPLRFEIARAAIPGRGERFLVAFAGGEEPVFIPAPEGGLAAIGIDVDRTQLEQLHAAIGDTLALLRGRNE